jgi:hypothetical protein
VGSSISINPAATKKWGGGIEKIRGEEPALVNIPCLMQHDETQDKDYDNGGYPEGPPSQFKILTFLLFDHGVTIWRSYDLNECLKK